MISRDAVTNRTTRAHRRWTDSDGCALLLLSGAVLGIVLAMACRVTEANSARQTNKPVSSVAVSSQSETPKASRERTADVVRRSRESVCLIEGTFIFRDRRTGHALRRNEWFVPGNDDILANPFSGTGFLVSTNGEIVTNRHVAQPWESDREAQSILSKGYRPVLTRLIAYFPGSSKPVRLKVARVAKMNDAAILVADPDAELPRPLPLAAEDNAAPGERVSLIGYPAGVRAILARNRINFERIHPSLSDLPDDQITRSLAARHAIEPFAWVGYISNSDANVLTVSAFVTDGSSGSPVLDEDGQVVGVVRASLTRVEAATLAVPAGAVRQLLGQSSDHGL
jgi:S1-C subfamily serine protease